MEAQQNFRSSSAVDDRLLPQRRKRWPEHKREPWWRPFNPKTDNPERQIAGVECAGTHPTDKTTLYYWRETYWRGTVK